MPYGQFWYDRLVHDLHQAKLLWLLSCPEALRDLLLEHMDERQRNRLFADMRALACDEAPPEEEVSHHIARVLLGKDGPLEMVEIWIRRHPGSAVARLFPQPFSPKEEAAILLMSLPPAVTAKIFLELGPDTVEKMSGWVTRLPLLPPGESMDRIHQEARSKLGIGPDTTKESLETLLEEDPKLLRQVLQRLQHTFNRYVQRELNRSQIQAGLLQCLPEPLLRFWMQDLSLEDFYEVSIASRQVTLSPEECDTIVRRLFEMLGKPDLARPTTIEAFARQEPARFAAYLREIIEC